MCCSRVLQSCVAVVVWLVTGSVSVSKFVVCCSSVLQSCVAVVVRLVTGSVVGVKNKNVQCVAIACYSSVLQSCVAVVCCNSVL